MQNNLLHFKIDLNKHLVKKKLKDWSAIRLGCNEREREKIVIFSNG
jgi:hypothetical protein